MIKSIILLGISLFLNPVLASNELNKIIEPISTPSSKPHSLNDNLPSEDDIESLLKNNKMADYQEFSKSEIIYLDKISGKKQILNLINDIPYEYQNITLTLKKCIFKKDHVKRSTLALIKIEENNQVVFHGWLSKEYPAVNQINHRFFNVLINNCN